ncbi:MAG: hypothetical protein ACPGEF_04775 [Endozoicomonas sp.]
MAAELKELGTVLVTDWDEFVKQALENAVNNVIESGSGSKVIILKNTLNAEFEPKQILEGIYQLRCCNEALEEYKSKLTHWNNLLVYTHRLSSCYVVVSVRSPHSPISCRLMGVRSLAV